MTILLITALIRSIRARKPSGKKKKKKKRRFEVIRQLHR